MQFRTTFPPLNSLLKISHQDPCFTIGSCFAKHIGGRLRALKFPALVNPFGIVYNPASICKSLEMLLSDTAFSETQLFENQGLWHSFYHHGHFSHPDKTVTLANIETSLGTAKAFFQKTTRLLVTLGTANVFVFKKTGEIVANCHKVPGQEFERKRLTVSEIAADLCAVFEKIKSSQDSLEIILTVSPVRHLRDGLVENQRSKANLLLAVEEVCRSLPFVHYFPAYEIVLDDLRDYRFFEKDMSHPNPVAVDYVWSYFEDAFFDEKTKALCREVEQVRAAAAHRPFNPQSVEHQNFRKRQLEKIAQLAAAYPFLDFEDEKENFQTLP